MSKQKRMEKNFYISKNSIVCTKTVHSKKNCLQFMGIGPLIRAKYCLGKERKKDRFEIANNPGFKK